MAQKTQVIDLPQQLDQHVELAGWVYHHRPSGKVQFLTLRDGTGMCQCIIERGRVDDETFEAVKHIGQETSLILRGRVRKDERSLGGVELVASEITILGPSQDYPITPKEHGVDFLLKNRHLHLRSHRQWCILKVRHTVIEAIREFFNTHGFTLIDTPIFTSLAGEGEQTLFEVDYFGNPIHLSQTGQLYLESACMSFGKVYCFGPTFRAEKSKTRRHLTEFWMVEPEVAFIDLPGLLDLAEKFVCHIVAKVLEKNRLELESLEADIQGLEAITPPFYRLTYTDAVDILTSDKTAKFMADQLESFHIRRDEITATITDLEQRLKSGLKKWQVEKFTREITDLRAELTELETKIENNPKHAELAASFQWCKDLGGSDETILSMMHDKPIFVTHYPRDAKAFYMRTDRDNPKVVENFDMLAPAGFGEVIGGSVREDEYDRLVARINEEGYEPEHYAWYLDLRKYGSVPHGGFGLGVERTVAWLTNEKHIRQCIPFPRLMDKVYI